MHRDRWSTLRLLLLVFFGGGCGSREHTVLAPRAGTGPDVADFADNPAAAGSENDPRVVRDPLQIRCRGAGLCETVPMSNDRYSECFDVVLPPELPSDPNRKRVSCALIWRVVSPPVLPFSCDQLTFAESVDVDPPGSMTVTCSIHQLAVSGGKPEPGEGFYWLDAAHVDPPCSGDPAAQGRIIYTPGAMPVVPGSSVVTWLDC